MNTESRIRALATLGRELKDAISQPQWVAVMQRAFHENGWFTTENSQFALQSIANAFLDEEKLRFWLKNYTLDRNHTPKKVGLVLAGNIPLAGWHDIMSVLLAGHQAQIKLSSKDEVLPKILINRLVAIEPAFASQIAIVERLTGFDAVIATGSGNTARYFEYYFGNVPHVIRANRNSLAVLTGSETDEELHALGKDMLQYFGLGCRSVCKLFVPENYQMEHLLSRLEPHGGILDSHKYANNYLYNQSLYLLNREKHLDTGYLLFKEDERLASPTAVIYYQRYQSSDEVRAWIAERQNDIQCVVGRPEVATMAMPFGNAQEPELWDYADGLDTMAFLLSLS